MTMSAHVRGEAPSVPRPAPGGVRAAEPGDEVDFFAADGRRLSATVVDPRGELQAAAVIAPAMGVPRSFYGAFARYLADGGVGALVFDYRGIGGSRLPGGARADASTLRDWGELDVPAAVAELGRRFPGVARVFVGHSVGGQLFGLDVHEEVQAAVFVGSQSGHWRHWSGMRRAGMFALWHLVIPAFVTGAGYLPMALLGQGQDVPAGVARDWAAWGRHRDYVMSYASPRGGVGFAQWAGRLRSYAILDDAYAPEPSVRALAAFYGAARTEVKRIEPADLGGQAVGHFGFFRPRFEASLWAEARAWLLRAGGADHSSLAK